MRTAETFVLKIICVPLIMGCLQAASRQFIEHHCCSKLCSVHSQQASLHLKQSRSVSNRYFSMG